MVVPVLFLLRVFPKLHSFLSIWASFFYLHTLFPFHLSICRIITDPTHYAKSYIRCWESMWSSVFRRCRLEGETGAWEETLKHKVVRVRREMNTWFALRDTRVICFVSRTLENGPLLLSVFLSPCIWRTGSMEGNSEGEERGGEFHSACILVCEIW